MKRLALLITALLIYLTASAQKVDYRIGITAGANYSKWIDKSSTLKYLFEFDEEDNASIKMKNLLGFYVGITGEAILSNNIYANISILYSTKGFRLNASQVDTYYDEFYYGKETTSLRYLDVPLHIGYRYDISPKISLLGEAGPYAAFLLSAKHSFKENVDGDKDKESFKSTDGITNYDYGVGFKVGAEFMNRYRVTIGCDWGAKNAISKSEAKENFKLKNRNMNLGITYFF